MANPNIVNVSLIRGKTAVKQFVKRYTQFLLRNVTNSNEVLKVNSIIATNRNTVNENITIQYVSTSGSFNVISGMNIPPRTTVNLMQKETSIYLEENTSLNVFSQSSNDNISITCSYEQIASSIVSDRNDNYGGDTLELVPTSPNIVTANLRLSFDAANTSSYFGSGNALIDLSGNGYVGRLSNGAFGNNANSGVIIFDGVDDHIAITEPSGIGGTGNIVGSGTSPFTVEIWFFNTRTLATGAYTMLFRVKQDTEFFGVLSNPSGTYNFYPVFRNFTQWGIPVTNSDFINKWICAHFVYTGGAKGTAASFKTYVNGVQIPVGTNNFGTAGGTGSNCNIIGADGNSGCNVTAGYHGGRISIYRLYNRELNLTEIQQNFNAIRARYGL